MHKCKEKKKKKVRISARCIQQPISDISEKKKVILYKKLVRCFFVQRRAKKIRHMVTFKIKQAGELILAAKVHLIS